VFSTACQEEFLANNPLVVKENDEHAPDFAPGSSPVLVFFGLGEFGL
jgi:hypothetical protein